MKKVILAVFLFVLVFAFSLNIDANTIMTAPDGYIWSLSTSVDSYPGKASNLTYNGNLNWSWNCSGVDGTCFSLSADKKTLSINDVHICGKPTTLSIIAEPIAEPIPD